MYDKTKVFPIREPEGGGSGGDVTAAGNNTFTGVNTFENNVNLGKSDSIITVNGTLQDDDGNQYVKETTVATENSTGVVQIGSGISVDQNGVISSTEVTVDGQVVSTFNADDKASIIDLENGVIVPKLANNLTPFSEDSGTTQENPFISQGTGTDNNSVIVTTGSIAKQLEKQGNTVVVKQLVPDNIKSGNINNGAGVASYVNAVIVTSNVTANAKLIVSVKITNSESRQLRAYCQIGSYSVYDSPAIDIPANSTKLCQWILSSGTYSDRVRIGLSDILTSTTIATGGTYSDACVFDITPWNSDIITDLTANPPHFSWYYNGSLAYDAGSLQNCNGRYLECGQGRCLWDKQWESGVYSISNGTKQDNANYIRSKNLSVCVPNKPIYLYVQTTETVILWYDSEMNYLGTYTAKSTSGIIDVPANAWFFNFYTKSSTFTDVTFSLYYTPEEGGEGYNQHYDYVAPIRIDTGNEILKAFDKKLPSGLITRDSISRNLKDLNWGTNVYDGVRYFYAKANNDFTKTSDLRNLIATCSPYPIVYNTTARKNLPDNGNITFWCTYLGGGITVAVRDDSISTVEDLIAKISGTLEVNKVTPTTEQGTPFSEYAPINDYSYMAWFDNDGNLVSIPQGCKLFYPVDYKGFIDDLTMYTNGDPTSLVRKSDMPSNKMYMYSLYIDELSTNENEEISVYFNVISKDPNLFVSDSDTIVKENNFKTLCENYSGVYFTAGGNVAFDDTGENKTVSYVKVNKYPTTYNLSIRFNEGGYYNKTIINNQGAFVEFAGLLSCGVKVEI